MTEYEIADLALSHAEAIRSQTALILQSKDSIQESITMFFGYVFAYTTVAYLVGPKLSRLEVSVLNFLYVVVIFLNRYSAYQKSQVQRELRNTLSQLQEVTPFPGAPTQYGLEIAIALHLTMVAATLAFMWSVRHPKKE